MTPSEIRGKEQKELWKLVEERRRQLFEFKLQLRTGQLAKTAEVEKTRRDAARLLTILHEKELGLKREGTATGAVKKETKKVIQKEKGKTNGRKKTKTA